jgi:hypothetical protein
MEESRLKSRDNLGVKCRDCVWKTGPGDEISAIHAVFRLCDKAWKTGRFQRAARSWRMVFLPSALGW